MIKPDTEIRLLMCPLEIDNQNQLTFENEQVQYAYFNALPSIDMDNCTFQRHDNSIRFAEAVDNILEYNYVMYKNEYYGDKWFYAFVTRMEYVNPNLTAIYIETDYFQTWQFDIIYKQCFVEREHVNDDTVGLHTVPENLETGEYITQDGMYYNGLDDLVYMMLVTEWSNSDPPPRATNFGGIPMAGGAYVLNDVADIIGISYDYSVAGKEEAIYNLYAIPKKMVDNTTTTGLRYSGQDNPSRDYTGIKKPNKIDGYIPKNNKLFTFPYQYLLLSNNNGSSNIYHFERFTDISNPNFCNFEVTGVPVVGGSIYCLPLNYDHSNNQYEERLVAGKFPVLSWAADPYINWLTQNSVNIAAGLLPSTLKLIGGSILMGSGQLSAGAYGVATGLQEIMSNVGSIYEHSFQPNSARGFTNGGDINVCVNQNGFWFYVKSIKSEYAKIIDNVFSMYGYKVNLLKVPNIKGRQNWNFVKTSLCNIEGDIPQSAIENIKDMFNRGVTLWHNPNTFLDYSQSNNII